MSGSSGTFRAGMSSSSRSVAGAAEDQVGLGQDPPRRLGQPGQPVVADPHDDQLGPCFGHRRLPSNLKTRRGPHRSSRIVMTLTRPRQTRNRSDVSHPLHPPLGEAPNQKPKDLHSTDEVIMLPSDGLIKRKGGADRASEFLVNGAKWGSFLQGRETRPTGNRIAAIEGVPVGRSLPAVRPRPSAIGSPVWPLELREVVMGSERRVREATRAVPVRDGLLPRPRAGHPPGYGECDSWTSQTQPH